MLVISNTNKFAASLGSCTFQSCIQSPSHLRSLSVEPPSTHSLRRQAFPGDDSLWSRSPRLELHRSMDLHPRCHIGSHIGRNEAWAEVWAQAQADMPR